jgi:hypothetical protein
MYKMEALNEVNELLTAKLCSPVIVFGVVAVISLITMFLCHRTLGRYNTQKMENLKSLCMTQEIKYLIILGVTMFGLCQYNKTDLAWIFLIFPIIYIIIQNSLLYIHLSSAVQNAPQAPTLDQAGSYGLGMQAPLLEQQGPPKAEITKSQEIKIPTVNSGGFEYAKPSNGFGSSMGSSSWDSSF